MNQNSGNSINWIVIGSISALFAVVLGAFGAHALKAILTDDLLKIYETGNRYHFYHSFAILIVGILSFVARMQVNPILNHSANIEPSNSQRNLSLWLKTSGYFFLFGIFIFSGSLYTLAITGIKWLGAITPVGGIFFMLGWLTIGVAAFRSKNG